MKIGISKSDSKIDIYLAWLDSYKIEYELLDYHHPEEGFEKFKSCSGLLLTGGGDVYPELYCDWDTAETKGTYKPERDGFELQLIESALKNKIPILAICRGLQLLNVYFRGSLIFDIWDTRKINHGKTPDNKDRVHGITIFKDTLLHKITGEEKAEVTSAHHQAIDRLGEGLMINARSEDGIIEGIEFIDKNNKSFLIGIQWHPERYKNFREKTSENILKAFISEAEKITLYV